MSEVILSSLAEAAAALAGTGLFGSLGGAIAEQVLAKAARESLKAGEVLFRQGEDGSCAYVVAGGTLDVLVNTGLGDVHMAEVERNQLVGEIAVFANLPRSATVVARTNATLLRLEREDVLSIIAANPEAGRAIIADLGRRLTMVNQPLAFLSVAAQVLRRPDSDAAMIERLTAQASDLGPFAVSFQEMVREIQAKQMRSQEMAMAARIQQSILPRPLESRADQPFAIHAFMRPTREVGGDLYDFFAIDDRHLAFIVADVSGKGVPASLFMAMFCSIVRAVAMPGMDVGQMLTRANALLAKDNDACMFVTVFFAVLNIETGRVTYSNAGHNPPYLLRIDGSRSELAAHDIAVGILENRVYATHSLDLSPGDRLFLFTDGVTEAFSPTHELFGEARLEALLDAMPKASVGEMVEKVVTEVDAFAAGFDQSDDITCLALAYRV
ncbi:MAG TPA: SpoIIE family protein phosphatase [Candidatus Sulfotelmatobacter sp.]|nr:SpoIIE family protein phosphatase [Candidatus Sulfotelmatobacter sp.]